MTTVKNFFSSLLTKLECLPLADFFLKSRARPKEPLLEDKAQYS
jgi:hypothetical protein